MMWEAIIFAACVVAALFLLYMWRTAKKLVLETVVISPDAGAQAASPATGIAAAATAATAAAASPDGRLRVVQLSDVHLHMKCAPVEKIVAMARGANPHVVILTGDYLEKASDAGRFLEFMADLTSAVARGDTGAGAEPGPRCKTAVLLCFGNHDNGVFEKSPDLKRGLVKNLKRLGVQVMENRSAAYGHNGKTYAFTGYSDFYTSPPSPGILRHGAQKGAAFHVGFSHNPDLALELKGPSPDLFICGHFHGGQIWLPFGIEYTSLRKERLCKMGIRRGLYEFGGRRVYISRGVGCVMFPLRLGSRPEITLFLI